MVRKCEKEKVVVRCNTGKNTLLCCKEILRHLNILPYNKYKASFVWASPFVVDWNANGHGFYLKKKKGLKFKISSFNRNWIENFISNSKLNQVRNRNHESFDSQTRIRSLMLKDV